MSHPKTSLLRLSSGWDMIRVVGFKLKSLYVLSLPKKDLRATPLRVEGEHHVVIFVKVGHHVMLGLTVHLPNVSSPANTPGYCMTL